MAILNDSVINGNLKITGMLYGQTFGSSTTINGKLVVNPAYDTASNSYNEGIRINKGSNGWAVLAIGGNNNSTSGTSATTWLIGQCGIATSKLAVGDLTIEPNGSAGNGLILYKGGGGRLNGGFTVNGRVAAKSIQVTTSGGLILGSPDNDSGDIIWYYGSDQEKMRIWTADSYDAATGPQFRIFKSDGTSLYNGTLVTGGGHGASGTWGISVSGISGGVKNSGPTTADVFRNLWFSDSATETTRVYSSNLMYNPVQGIRLHGLSSTIAVDVCACPPSSGNSESQVNVRKPQTDNVASLTSYSDCPRLQLWYNSNGTRGLWDDRVTANQVNNNSHDVVFIDANNNVSFCGTAVNSTKWNGYKLVVGSFATQENTIYFL